VPVSMDLTDVECDLQDIDGVTDVHDLHVWTLTSGMHVATAHLVTAAGAPTAQVLTEARAVLRDQHGIAHATLQVELHEGPDCHELGW